MALLLWKPKETLCHYDSLMSDSFNQRLAKVNTNMPIYMHYSCDTYNGNTI